MRALPRRWAETRAGPGVDIGVAEVGPAPTAREPRLHGSTAAPVQQQPRRTRGLGVVTVTPPQQVGDHRQEGTALLREVVGEALGSLLVGDPLEDALLDEVP
jgi:hypothetical protein